MSAACTYNKKDVQKGFKQLVRAQEKQGAEVAQLATRMLAARLQSTLPMPVTVTSAGKLQVAFVASDDREAYSLADGLSRQAGDCLQTALAVSRKEQHDD